MRRNRMRSYTIDAENEEEFIKEYDRMQKSRLSQLNFEEKIKNEEILEDEEEDGLSFHKQKKLNNSGEEDEYSGLGGTLKGYDEDEEDNLGKDIYDDEDILKESEDDLIKIENNEERGIEILCYYLKNSIIEISSGKKLNNKESIFYKNNKNIKAMSGNAIYDLNIRDLVDNILAENDNEIIKSPENNSNSLRDYILQNIESDNILKIMFMSNNKLTKNSFIKKLFGLNSTKNENENEEVIDEPFEIRKKQIKLFSKNISLQIFDTSDEFHNNSISKVYYKNNSAFFILIEASNHNCRKYLDFIYEKIEKYINNKTCILFGINMLFKEDCTIDGDNLREYANEKNMMYIPIKIKDFDLKNNLIINLLNLILIKSLDSKSSRESLRKFSNHRKLGGFKKKLVNKINDSSKKNNLYDMSKMKIVSSLGYKKKYRINHINAFDIDDNNKKSINRKLSADI